MSARTYKVYRNEMLFWEGIAHCEVGAVNKAKLKFYDNDESYEKTTLDQRLTAIWFPVIKRVPFKGG